MPRYYILLDHTPVAVDRDRWAKWFKTADRRVAFTELSHDCDVSTVFLGLDHGYRGDEPVLFETMVLGGPHDGEMWRYCSWDDAERGHAEAVASALTHRIHDG